MIMPPFRYSVISKALFALGLLIYAFVGSDINAAWITLALLALAALTGWFAWRDWRRPPPAEPPLNLRMTLSLCGAVLAIDTLWFGAPALGVYAVLALVLWLTPRILLAWRKPELRRHRARVALVVLGMLLLNGGIYSVYEIVAQKRMTEVAEALVRYKISMGTYPERLQQLVPDYLRAIPPAKPGVIMMRAIWYHHTAPDQAALMYVSFPPYYRKVLDLHTLQWSTMD